MALRAFADVVICAPETEQSTTSHSLTLTRPLASSPLGDASFAVDGTPADCVYVALNAGTRVFRGAPDSVVSGMNHGLNLGTDVFYSGTVAAAREGAPRGMPALAASADAGADPQKAAADLRRDRARVAPRSSGRTAPAESSAPTSLPPTRTGSRRPDQRQCSAGLEWQWCPRASGFACMRTSSSFGSTLAVASTSGSGGAGQRHEPLVGLRYRGA